MDNKVLVNVSVPEVNRSFDVFLPVNRKVGNIIGLLTTAINELSNGDFPIADDNGLFNADTGELYSVDVLLYDTSIRNGTKLILITSK